ncbi:MAG: DUF1559 domain-containing protein [Planctomycetes bacterium]|nr:DUF1559 domain-containing protein [Planctomycetota bacterium]
MCELRTAAELRSRPNDRRVRQTGFTIVELLVVVAIIGILVALLLPAVQAAREAARNTTCKNHLKQLGLACQQHHDSHNHLPTGGWGYRWVGDATRGFGKGQPGGWLFNVLPYIDQASLRDMAGGTTDAERERTAQSLRMPIPIFNCPSRRAGLFTNHSSSQTINSAPTPVVARSDYAGNEANDWPTNGGDGAGPQTIDDSNYRWPDNSVYNGVIFQRSMVQHASIRDGLSNTLLIGEKFLDPNRYNDGSHWADVRSQFTGFSLDVGRFAIFPPKRDIPGDPQNGVNDFGSAHPNMANFAFCDGSIRPISYSIDSNVFRAIGSRNGGEAHRLPPD